MSRPSLSASPSCELAEGALVKVDAAPLVRPWSFDEAEFKMKVMAGLDSMISTQPGLDESVNDAIVAPWADAYRALMERAADRDEIPRSASIETVSQVIPTVAAHRALIQRKPFDRDFLVLWIDDVVLPAQHHGASGATPR